MFEKLNDIIGIGLLVAVVGGAAIYGLVVVFTAPPLIRQESQGEGYYQRQARKALEKRLGELQEQQAEAFKEAAEYGRRARSSW